MPKFAYQAKKGPQEKVSGTIEAKTERQAIALVEESGLFPIRIEEIKEDSPLLTASGLSRIRLMDIAVFARQFSNLIEAGLTVTQALSVLAQQTAHPGLKRIIIKMQERINDGSTLSDALQLYPRQFPQFYCAMVKAGELSGALDTVLGRLADFSEQEERIRSDVLSALTYPALILSVGAVTIYALLTFVVPKLTAMFEEMEQVMPLPTQMLIGISNIFRAYWWFALLSAAIIFFIIKRPKSNEENLFWDALKLKLPLIGRLIQKSEMAHFVRTLSLLLESGVSMLVSLEAVGNTLTNTAIKSEVSKIAQDIKDGASLSVSLKKSSYFPVYISNIASVGEEAGTLDKSLKRIAISYEQELARVIRALTTLLEPVLILVMGLVVAFIVAAMLLPIFQINLMAR